MKDVYQEMDLKAYDAIMTDYYQTERQKSLSFIDKYVEFFRVVRRPDVLRFIKEQGFLVSEDKDLAMAKFHIASTIHKLKESQKSLEAKENPARYKPQLTLIHRRIEAFTLALEAIDMSR